MLEKCTHSRTQIIVDDAGDVRIVGTWCLTCKKLLDFRLKTATLEGEK